MPDLRMIVVLFLAACLVAAAQTGKPQPKSAHKDSAKPAAPSPSATQSEDISGMYSFLAEGEFVQINREEDGITGYISRMGDRESDRGSFLDQFFSKASVQGTT